MTRRATARAPDAKAPAACTGSCSGISVTRMLGYLLGAYTTSIASGLVIVFSLDGSSAAKSTTHVLGPSGDIAAGVVALAIALTMATGHETTLRRWRKRPENVKASNPQAKEPWHTRMIEKGSAAITFVVGAAMTFPGVTYVNALDHIAHLNPRDHRRLRRTSLQRAPSAGPPPGC